ncbi:hypothetical protein RHGRI_028397 [Rhododendron griersonianum]|uniref:Uncharacterized protein n=1 Tax=Rhododendron griersonianum TaxID=479676 RepID=A0AAV6IJK2_9ERIC|nr:hypothetical protein RHGRI_028397 [Rhododendron griersonianum]
MILSFWFVTLPICLILIGAILTYLDPPWFGLIGDPSSFMAEASSSSTIVPDFDPNSYDPLPHEFKPTGLKLHKLKTVVHDDDVVLREPDTHFSVYNREIWSYEFLGMFVPQNEYPDPMVIPRGLKWMRDSKGRKEGARDLVAYRAFLDQLQEDQVTQIVEWDVWAEIEEKASEDLLRSRVANGRRILLEGPFCREWYLGERVVRQSLGYGAFRVPKSIPQLSSRKLAKDDLIEWLEGHDAVAFLEEEGKDYGEYKTQWLMGPLGASSAESGRRQGLRARAMPTAVARGRGSEVQKRSRRAKLPKLPRRVSYTLDSGYVKCIDLPDPRSGMYCLPSNVEQVSREYAEACLRTIASLEVVIRRQAIAAHASALHVPQGTSLVRPVQGSRATSSTADQGIIVSSDGDDDEEETGSEEEDEEEDSKSGSSGSEPLGSEDTDNVTLSAMTRKTSKKYSRQDMTSRLPLKRQRKK